MARNSRGRATVTMRRRSVTAKKSTSTSLEQPEEPEERNFISAHKISPHLTCPVCTEVFIRPMRCPCGHSFCEQCIEPWLKNGNENCPLDRKPLFLKNLHHDFILESIIGDHKVSCPWRNLGCSFVEALHLLKDHKMKCHFNPNHLPTPLRQRQLELLNRTVNIQVIAKPEKEQSQISNTNAVVESESDDEFAAPPPGPSLLFRLYNNTDSSLRENLVTILGAEEPPAKKLAPS